MTRKVFAAAVFFLAFSGALRAQLDSVQFSKQDAAAMPIESAIEIAESYMGPSWLQYRKTTGCVISDLSGDVLKVPESVKGEVEVQLQWFQRVTKYGDAGITVDYKNGDMSCSQFPVRPKSGDGVDLASALWRLSLEPDDSAVADYYAGNKQLMGQAAAADRLMEMGDSVAKAKPILKEFGQEMASRVEGAAKHYSIPQISSASVSAKDVLQESTGQTESTHQTELSDITGESVRFSIETIARRPEPSGDSRVNVNGVTSQYEIPAAGGFYTDDRRNTQVEGSGKRIDHRRKKMKREGQAGYLPAELGQPMYFSQAGVQAGGPSGDIPQDFHRVCVPVSEGSFEVAGRGYDTLIFECAFISEDTHKISGANYINLGRGLETVEVSLETGIPLRYESLISTLFAGQEQRYLYEYSVQALRVTGVNP